MAPIALCLLLFVLAAPPAHAGSWQRPVDGELLRDFTRGGDPYARGRHRGVDLAAPLGSAVRSACAGRVSFLGRLPGGGLTVSVRCGPLIATYQHLGSAAGPRGRAVVGGARLGAVGRSGRPWASRPHVHLGVRVAATGDYVDPLALIDGAPLLPPAPAPVPGSRRPPLGPAPVPLRAPPRPLPTPYRAPPGQVPAPLPRAAPAPASSPAPVAAPKLPWPVWLGLACVLLGLPLGGFVRLRRRRRATAVVAQTA